MANVLPIAIRPGSTRPQYDESSQELAVESAVITEQATALRLPVVELKLRGPDGQLYLAVLTGRQVCTVAAAVRGINERNHGTPEP